MLKGWWEYSRGLNIQTVSYILQGSRADRLEPLCSPEPILLIGLWLQNKCWMHCLRLLLDSRKCWCENKAWQSLTTALSAACCGHLMLLIYSLVSQLMALLPKEHTICLLPHLCFSPKVHPVFAKSRRGHSVLSRRPWRLPSPTQRWKRICYRLSTSETSSGWSSCTLGQQSSNLKIKILTMTVCSPVRLCNWKPANRNRPWPLYLQPAG